MGLFTYAACGSIKSVGFLFMSVFVSLQKKSDNFISEFCRWMRLFSSLVLMSLSNVSDLLIVVSNLSPVIKV